MSAVDEILKRYRASKGLDEELPPRPYVSKESRQIAALRAEVQKLEGELREVKMHFSELQHRYQFELDKNHSTVPGWIMRHLKFFIFACHPDRNSGRAEATEVMKELLKLR